MDNNLERMSRDELYQLIDHLTARVSRRRLVDYSEREADYKIADEAYTRKHGVSINTEYQRQAKIKRKAAKPNK